MLYSWGQLVHPFVCATLVGTGVVRLLENAKVVIAGLFIFEPVVLAGSLLSLLVSAAVGWAYRFIGHSIIKRAPYQTPGISRFLGR